MNFQKKIGGHMQNSQITKPQEPHLVALKKLNNQELHLQVKNLASQERKLTEKILWHIAEVDSRKLYLGMAHSSLFNYLTKEIGYTAGSAQRRIDGARLLQKLPEVADKIKEGSLNLGQISKLQCVQRQFKKESGVVVSLTEQRNLLQNLENKSLEQTDLILAQHFNLAVTTHETKRIQKDESVRIELTFSKEEMELLQEVQALMSNQTGGSLKATVLELAKKYLKTLPTKSTTSSRRTCAVDGECSNRNKKIQSQQMREMNQTRDNRQNLQKNTKTDAKVAVSSSLVDAKTSRYIPVELKRTIFKRDQHCQFKDLKTNKICGSKYFLEIDHIMPKHQNGGNELKNLRMLCANHNKYRYLKSLP